MFLNNINYSVGKQEKLENLNVGSKDETILGRLKGFGIDSYRASGKSIYELSLESIEKTLCGYNKDSIDKFIFSTSSFHDSFKRTGTLEDVNEVIKSVEIDAYPYGVYLSECLNFFSALNLAASLLRNENDGSILISTSDKIGKGESRIIPPGFSVKSDGAASCIICNDKSEGAVEVLGVYQKHNSKMLRKDEPLSPEGLSREFSWCLEKVKEEFLVNYNNDYKFIITHNYNKVYPRTIAYLLGLDVGRFYIDNVCQYAHCFSADILINLDNLLKSDSVNKGDEILTIGTSPSSVGAAIFKV